MFQAPALKMLIYKSRARIEIVSSGTCFLLVDPVLGCGRPAHELLGLEPQTDLVLGRINSVGAVADVAANLIKKRIPSQRILPLS
jgi:hypothetical protein